MRLHAPSPRGLPEGRVVPPLVVLSGAQNSFNMPQQIVIAEQLRIAAVLNDERVDELVVAQGRYQIGDVYLGTVENVLPGIDAAFVNIGESEKNGFIHVTDLGPLRLRKGAAGITELLEPRQKVLVQVMKEPTGTKGPRLTGNLTLPGRFLVLQPHGQGVNISRRINGENERNRLRALGVLIKPPGAGLLIRTEAEGVGEDLLIDDLETLLKQWEAIQQAAETASPPSLLNRDEDFVHRVLRDLYSPEVLRVVVDTPAAVDRVHAFLGADPANLLVECHQEPGDILEHYRVHAAIRDALKPRVDLPSGGYVIIEPTEALTVIDVNSGSFTRSANARETVLWTNCEAAVEIARQLKLRNIGGVVIVDFIDMDSRRDQLQLLEHFTEAVRNDSARPQIAQLTELGLVELTRKRQGQNLYELFGRACPSCGGLGHVAVLPGRDTLQPLATVSGLVRSAASARAEVASPATAEGGTGAGRRRRGGRGGRGGGAELAEAPFGAGATAGEPARALPPPLPSSPRPRRVVPPAGRSPRWWWCRWSRIRRWCSAGWASIRPFCSTRRPPPRMWWCGSPGLGWTPMRCGRRPASNWLPPVRAAAAAGAAERAMAMATALDASAPRPLPPSPSPAAPLRWPSPPLPVDLAPEEVMTVTVSSRSSSPSRRGRSAAAPVDHAPAEELVVVPLTLPPIEAEPEPEPQPEDAGEPRRRRRRSSATV